MTPCGKVKKTTQESSYTRESALHKAARNRQDSMKGKHETHLTKLIHKRSTALERNVLERKLLEILNMFDGSNLNLISDVDQDI